MIEKRTHQSHPRIVNRLKRADGHLRSIIDMIENNRSCAEIAQQLHAVEKAVMQAKKTLIYDHLDHCLDEANCDPETNSEQMIEEFKTISRYL